MGILTRSLVDADTYIQDERPKMGKKTLIAVFVCAFLVLVTHSQWAWAEEEPVSGGEEENTSTNTTTEATCPPEGFDSKQDGFNLTAWTDSPWFIQEQMPVIYQPVTYVLHESSLCDARGRKVSRRVQQRT